MAGSEAAGQAGASKLNIQTVQIVKINSVRMCVTVCDCVRACVFVRPGCLQGSRSVGGIGGSLSVCVRCEGDWGVRSRPPVSEQ